MNEFKILLAIIPALKELIFKQQPPLQVLKQNKYQVIIIACVIVLAITALLNVSFFKDEHRKVNQLTHAATTVSPNPTVPQVPTTVPTPTFDKQHLKEQLESEE